MPEINEACGIFLDTESGEKLTHFCEKNKSAKNLGIAIGPEG
jgi:16S rRNA U1498 N3-methylase RsmE